MRTGNSFSSVFYGGSFVWSALPACMRQAWGLVLGDPPGKVPRSPQNVRSMADWVEDGAGAPAAECQMAKVRATPPS